MCFMCIALCVSPVTHSALPYHVSCTLFTNLSSNFSYLDDNFELQTFNRANNQSKKDVVRRHLSFHRCGYVQGGYFGYHQRKTKTQTAGQVAKNATPRHSGWESNPRPMDYQTSALQLIYRSRCRQLRREFSIYINEMVISVKYKY